MIATAEKPPLQKPSEFRGLIVYRDEEALRYLASHSVQAGWRALWEHCPWATALQRPEYVCTWYRCYSGPYLPLVVAQDGAAGSLDGLMTLAVDTRSGALVFAGAGQAEYHSWLARTGPQTFITAALRALGRLGFSTLTFTYLPPGTPLDWLEGEWRERSLLRPVLKPLMDIGNGDEVRESLRKKSNKSRMNRLARHGPVEFVELTTLEELDREYDDIVAFTDFRQGAIHDVCPFADDPRKRGFYRELLRQPELLHVTVMRTGGKAIAAHIGLRSGPELILGIICYSPFVAEHSPGKFHLLLLALLLREQRFSALDLTPGDDTYKERLATRHEEAHSLTIVFNLKGLKSERAKAWMRGCMQRAAAALPVHPDRLRQYRALAHEVVSNPARAMQAAARMARMRLWSTVEMRFYRLPAALLPAESGDEGFKRDSLADLLLYDSDRSMPPRQEFLREAMAAIEAGAHVYTYAREGRLLHCGWLTPRTGKSFIAELQHEFAYPANSAVLWNFYSHPSCHGHDLHAQCLRRIFADIRLTPETEFAYIAVRANDTALRRVVEKVGFLYQASILRRSRLNRTQFTCHESPESSGKEHDGRMSC